MLTTFKLQAVDLREENRHDATVVDDVVFGVCIGKPGNNQVSFPEDSKAMTDWRRRCAKNIRSQAWEEP